MKKVLIIVYYWPPSGGAGVQRWMKLSKYLAEQGVDTHVLTVDPRYASYLTIDESLEDEVSPKVHVHRTKSFEPINLFARVAGKKNVPTAGFANITKLTGKQKFVNFMRSHIFIPDPRKGWNKYAYKAAKKIIRENQINTVIVSSPPHSHQFTGYRLKKRLGVQWIADMRDPWTDIYYYDLLQHSKMSASIDRKKERTILESADKVLTVSQGLIDDFMKKSSRLTQDKFVVLPNGFDPEDFENIIPKRETSEESFTLSYTGTMSEQYNPSAFFDAMAATNDVQLQLIGRWSGQIRQEIEQKGLSDRVCYIDPVPHKESISYLKGSDALLLIIPDIPKNKGILTGKLFEYLASRKPIVCIGPRDGDAATIIHHCKSGWVYDRTQRDLIKECLEELKSGKSITPVKSSINEYSRKEQAYQIQEWIAQ